MIRWKPPFVAALVVAVVPVCGGSYRALTELHLRASALVAAALGTQIVIISLVEFDSVVVSQALHIATYLAMGWFLALNRHVRWLWLLGVGWACNSIAVVVNGGVMPTSSAAAKTLGRTPTSTFENSAPASGARLAFLGDVFATPRTMPLANAFSIGDILLVVGLVLVVASASRGAASPRQRGVREVPPAAV